MASPVVQSASEATGSSATPTITEPASAVSGDLLVAVVGSADAGTAITGLTGWTQLGEGDDGVGNRYWYGWIIRGGSAPDLVAAAANASWVAMCVRIDGHDATTPIGSDHGTATGTSVNPDAPNVDPGSSDDYLAVLGVVQEGKNDNRFTDTTPSGYTEQADIGTTGGGAGTAHIGGAMNSRVYTGQAENPGTHTSSRNDGWIAITMIVSPVAGIDYTESETEAVGVTDSTTPAKSIPRAKAEAIGVTDVVSRVAPAVRSKSEAIGVVDSITTAKSIPQAIAEAIGVTDSVVAAKTIKRVIEENQYLSLPGSTGHYASTPDHADFDVVDVFEGQVFAALDDWTPPSTNTLAAQWTAVGNQRGWNFKITLGGRLQFGASSNGSTNENVSHNGPNLPDSGFIDGIPRWVGFQFDGGTVRFYDGGIDRDSPVWVELGTGATLATITSIHNSTGIVEVGSFNTGTGSRLTGRVYSFRLWDDFTETTLVTRFNAEDFLIGDSDTDTAVDSTGKTWTINGLGSRVGPGVLVTDSVTRVHEAKRIIDETVGVSDSTTRVHDAKRIIDETVGVSDSTARVHDAKRISTEAVGVTDSVSSKLTIAEEVTEAVGITDAVSRVAPAAREISEAVGVADVVTSAKTIQVVVTEPVGVTDDTTPAKTIPRTVNESVGVTDIVVDDLTIGGDIFRTVTEAVGLTDSTTRVHDAKRSSDEAVGVTDVVAAKKTIRVTITEAVGVADSTSSAKTVMATVTEAVGVVDSASRIHDAKRSITEVVGLTDSTTADKGINVVVTESVGITDSTSPIKAAAIAIVEGVGVSDTTTGAKAVVVSVTEAVGVLDSVNRVVDYAKAIFEGVDITDVVSTVFIPEGGVPVVREFSGSQEDMFSRKDRDAYFGSRSESFSGKAL